MLGLITNLAKAAVGVAVETPLSLAADVATLGGTLNDKEKPYTVEALSNVLDNVKAATKEGT